MFSVRQKDRCSMEHFLACFVALHQRCGLSTTVGNAIDNVIRRCGVQNDALGTPRRASWLSRKIGKNLRHTSEHVDFLELSVDNPGEITAVGRPKGKAGSIGTGEFLRSVSGKRP